MSKVANEMCLNNLEEGLIILDTDRNVLFANSAAMELDFSNSFGYYIPGE